MTWTSLFYIIPLAGMIYLLVRIWKGLSYTERKLVKQKAVAVLFVVIKLIACILYAIFVILIVSLVCNLLTSKGEK